MKTLALVIGNDNYPMHPLTCAVNDATEIADRFKSLGYDVILSTNCSRDKCDELINEYQTRLPNYEATIFYYAGHGFEFKGENYFTVVDFPFENARMSSRICEHFSIRLSELIKIYKEANTSINIVILDACRKELERGSGTSFAPINVPRGTLIAFSTSPGEGAKDAGFNGHSIYTGALLTYLGQEMMTTEELFKKVRKVVHHMSGGTQTSWEHTSLIGDFIFTTLQNQTIEIPYSDEAIHDYKYLHNETEIDDVITNLKSGNWNFQNPAIEKLAKIEARFISKDTQFVLGRNILQAGEYSIKVTKFLEQLAENLKRFSNKGENHVLNGILFEIYFDKNGTFRLNNLKKRCINYVLPLRTYPIYKKSFEFICKLLEPYSDQLFYIPYPEDKAIEVFVHASIKMVQTFDNLTKTEVIEDIIVKDVHIAVIMSQLCQSGGDELYLKTQLSTYLAAPLELIRIISNTPLQKIMFLSPFDYNKDLSL